MATEIENSYNCSLLQYREISILITSRNRKLITVEQNTSEIFLSYGMYKEAVELLISMQPKRIEMKKDIHR